MTQRADLEQIFKAAVASVEPAALVRRHLALDEEGPVAWDDDGSCVLLSEPVLVVGAGKAAAGMAQGAEAVLGKGARGLVVTADGCQRPLANIAVRCAGHPLPDDRSENAARELCELIATTSARTVLVLLSGGASSLLALPRPPVTLGDKIALCRDLHRSGADIRELNTVRKHLSLIKGGGIAKLAGDRRVVAMILSDVPGDDVATIGSGPTAADPTTFADALEILTRYELTESAPTSVLHLLREGAAGREAETPKALNPEQVTNLVIGSNRTALEAAASMAAELAYEPVVRLPPLTGDTAAAAQTWVAEVLEVIAKREHRKICVLAGGETTVRVSGSGSGGRNQEFALCAAAELAGTSLTILSAGTDGIDGPTDAAGAFADGETLTRARALGLDWKTALRENDSYRFFERLGDLLRCGPTGTNVGDLKIAVVSGNG